MDFNFNGAFPRGGGGGLIRIAPASGKGVKRGGGGDLTQGRRTVLISSRVNLARLGLLILVLCSITFSSIPWKPACTPVELLQFRRLVCVMCMKSVSP